MNAGRRGGGQSIDAGLLVGWRVLVPRPADRAAELLDALLTSGAQPVAVELISISSPLDAGPFDRCLIELAGGFFGWVGFTSVNAVEAVVQRAAALGLPLAVPAGTRVAAVGPATAAALRHAGLSVDLQPPTAGSADALAAVWPRAGKNAAVLLPRSDIAPAALPAALAALGYRVEAVTAYRTVVQPVPDEVAAELATGAFDAVLFTSPSTVKALHDVDIGASTVLGAIGQPTTRACAAAGWPAAFTAPQPTARSLVEGLADFALAHPRPWKHE